MPSQNHRVMTALDIRTEREERPTRLCTVLLTQETRVPGVPPVAVVLCTRTAEYTYTDTERQRREV